MSGQIQQLQAQIAALQQENEQLQADNRRLQGDKHDFVKVYKRERQVYSQQQLYDVLNCVDVHIAIMKNPGQIDFVNEMAAYQAGFASAEDYFANGGENACAQFEILDVDGNLLSAEEMVCDTVFQRAQVCEQTVCFHHKDTRQDHWALVRAVPSLDETGQVELAVVYTRFISEQRNTEEALRRSEGALRTLADANPEALFIVDTEGIIQIANLTAAELLGKAQDELPGQCIYDLIPPDPGEGRGEKINEVIRKRQPLRFADQRDGRQYFQHLVPQLDRDGNVATIVFLVVDITEQVETQQAYRILVDNSLQEIIILQDKKVVFANPSAVRNSGYSLGELLSVSEQEVIQLIHPEDYLKLKNYVLNIVEGTIKPQLIEGRLFHKDGNLRWIEMIAVPIEYQHKPAVQLVMMDMTERQYAQQSLHDSETRYRQLVESLNEGIWVADKNATTTFVNKRMAEMLGYSVEEVLNKPLFNFMPLAQQKRTKSLLEHRKEGISEQYEAVFKKKEGSIIHALVNASPLRDEAGDYIGSLSAVIDISKRLEAENKLQRSLEEKVVLLREIHHRVKNNLQIICSLLDMQLEYIRDPEAQMLFRDSQERIHTMSLVHERLYQSDDLSHIEFSSYLQELGDYLQMSYAITPVAVSFDLQEDIYLSIDIAIPCGLIFSELVSNAYKYAFPQLDDNHKLAVSFRECFEKASYELIIADNGVGLPPEAMGPEVDTLGLNLVTLLAKQLGGSIEVNSHPGNTRWQLSFPTSSQD